MTVFVYARNECKVNMICIICVGEISYDYINTN